ncbi:putative TetR family transcriptional regulator [Gordonia effusa NBRC 100432]|uniref:Putative TetR family transcriptional regulator n=1 Tax=Gordonia effusa NBRC 100432 TaxID=1077974 RepID=H0R2M2_9ACTN|nr:TetR/AcrR family transcriptional regulator [Gordonia effusa]GAB19323.1 putative TetR family transcriptional regulator [Gordonia effusa NBRC 100432]
MSSRVAKRQAIEAQILDLGRTQLATVGAAALSLRAIARELGMVSSAIYRYVESRDELLTRLVVEAYGELGDAVDAAVSKTTDVPRERVYVLANAFRDWSIANTAQFALLYGSPVPGYHAPAERTVEPGTRVMRTLIGTLAQAAVVGELAVSGDVDAELTHDLAAVRAEVGVELDDAGLVFAVSLWTWLIGAVSQEIFGGFGSDTFSAPALLFDAQLRQRLDGTSG